MAAQTQAEQSAALKKARDSYLAERGKSEGRTGSAYVDQLVAARDAPDPRSAWAAGQAYLAAKKVLDAKAKLQPKPPGKCYAFRRVDASRAPSGHRGDPHGQEHVMVRGHESRRRRGCHVDLPRRRVAAPPRPRRGHSVETGGCLSGDSVETGGCLSGDSVGDGSRRRRGQSSAAKASRRGPRLVELADAVVVSSSSGCGRELDTGAWAAATRRRGAAPPWIVPWIVRVDETGRHRDVDIRGHSSQPQVRGRHRRLRHARHRQGRAVIERAAHRDRDAGYARSGGRGPRRSQTKKVVFVMRLARGARRDGEDGARRLPGQRLPRADEAPSGKRGVVPGILALQPRVQAQRAPRAAAARARGSRTAAASRREISRTRGDVAAARRRDARRAAPSERPRGSRPRGGSREPST